MKEFSSGQAQLTKVDQQVAPVDDGQALKPKIIIPTEPPAEFEFCHDPPTLNALELDIVKECAENTAEHNNCSRVNDALRR